MPGCEANQDSEFCRCRENKTYQRNCVRLYSTLNPYLISEIFCRHAVRVSPQFSNRMIEAARSVLNRYIPDIYLYSDVYKGEDSGKYVDAYQPIP